MSVTRGIALIVLPLQPASERRGAEPAWGLGLPLSHSHLVSCTPRASPLGTVGAVTLHFTSPQKGPGRGEPDARGTISQREGTPEHPLPHFITLNHRPSPHQALRGSACWEP